MEGKRKKKRWRRREEKESYVSKRVENLSGDFFAHQRTIHCGSPLYLSTMARNQGGEKA